MDTLLLKVIIAVRLIISDISLVSSILKNATYIVASPFGSSRSGKAFALLQNLCNFQRSIAFFVKVIYHTDCFSLFRIYCVGFSRLSIIA